jgi:hypothetical protein
MGRRLRALFNAAGVSDLQITGTALVLRQAPSDTAEWGDSCAARLLTSPMGERAVEYGYASRADLEAMAAASAHGPFIPTRSGRSCRSRRWRASACD